jgi:ribosomal-protein-alanine N-acetyltransferase
MAATVPNRGLIWKLQLARRQMLTAFNLTLGSFITHHWVSISDKNVTNVSGEMLNGVLRLYNENFTEINEKRFTNTLAFLKRRPTCMHTIMKLKATVCIT